MHFYDFNIGDYAKKTRHLTNDEDLAYRRLLDIYYDSEKPFQIKSGGLSTLSRRVGIPENVVKNVIDEFFPEGINKHADEKISAYHLFLAKQSENGRKGGRPKNHIVTNTFENENNPPLNGGKPTDNPVPSQPLTTKPLTTNQEPREATPSPKPKKTKPTNPLPMVAGGDGFQVFWAAYPKKTGKVDAGKAWVKAKPCLDDVLKALEWQRVSAQWTRKAASTFQTHPPT